MGWFSKQDGGGEVAHDYEAEIEDFRSRKMDDSYQFTYDFTYIAKNLGNDEYEDGTATMVCDVAWDDTAAGYRVAYNVPDMRKIDPSEGNGDADSFYEGDVYWRVMSDLDALGIDSTLRCV